MSDEYWLRVSWFAGDTFTSRLRAFNTPDERALAAIDELALGNAVQHAGRHELRQTHEVVFVSNNLRALLSCIIADAQNPPIHTTGGLLSFDGVLKAVLMGVAGIGDPETLILKS